MKGHCDVLGAGWDAQALFSNPLPTKLGRGWPEVPRDPPSPKQFVPLPPARRTPDSVLLRRPSTD